MKKLIIILCIVLTTCTAKLTVTENPQRVFVISVEDIDHGIQSQKVMLHYALDGIPYTAFFPNRETASKFLVYLEKL